MIPKPVLRWITLGYDGVDGPVAKPHGRRAWSIPVGGGLYFDVSVMPREGA